MGGFTPNASGPDNAGGWCCLAQLVGNLVSLVGYALVSLVRPSRSQVLVVRLVALAMVVPAFRQLLEVSLPTV